MPIEVAVIVVAHEGRAVLAECLASVIDSHDRFIEKRVIVVDNASTDGTAEMVSSRFPGVEVVSSPVNLGFAGGANLGWRHVDEHCPDVDFVCVLNQDTVVESGWLAALCACAWYGRAACVQSKVLLHQDPRRLNTAGNVSHFLGFGFTTGHGEIDLGQYDKQTAIGFASGASFLTWTEFVREHGLFDEEYFLYLEDAELGWKARQMGLEVLLAPASRVRHRYEFRSDFSHYYWLERNRWLLILTYYRAPTLLLILPALALMELGQWVFALRHGLVNERARVYAYFFNRKNLQRLRERRRAAAARRRVSDREFLARATGRLDRTLLNSWLVRRVASPLFAAYWAVARRLIFW